jgi:hypothetical protein
MAATRFRVNCAARSASRFFWAVLVRTTFAAAAAADTVEALVSQVAFLLVPVLAPEDARMREALATGVEGRDVLYSEVFW